MGQDDIQEVRRQDLVPRQCEQTVLPPAAAFQVIASPLPSQHVPSKSPVTRRFHLNLTSNMPPKKSKIDCDLEPYFQYHNRIASFLDWNLDWELSDDKPSPERLARAGFFSFTKHEYQDDNVVCPYCTIALDSWECQDDPMQEHRARSPFCNFVLGRQTVRNMNGADDDNDAATATTKITINEQNNTNDVPRPKRSYKKRAAGASKANELALAGANGEEEGPPQKRRPGRPKKRSGAG